MSGAPHPASPKRPFVSSLRTRKAVIRLAPPEATDVLTIRVEMLDVWDAVVLEVLPTDQVLEVKTRALQALDPAAEIIDEYVLKLRGWDILDEGQSLADAGVINGSILLLTHRRRRPVR